MQGSIGGTAAQALKSNKGQEEGGQLGTGAGLLHGIWAVSEWWHEKWGTNWLLHGFCARKAWWHEGSKGHWPGCCMAKVDSKHMALA